MRLFRTVLVAAAMMLVGLSASIASAQATYPTAASGVRATGVVPLQCDASSINCAPVQGDTNGVVVQPALSSVFWRYAAPVGGITNSAATVVAKASAGVGVRNYVSSMQCSSTALGAATELLILDGGTPTWRGYIGTAGLPSIVTITFNPPIRGTTNANVGIQTATASVTGSVYCGLQGYAGF